MEGLELLKMIVDATGLPNAAVERELTRILQHRGLDAHSLKLSDVREVLSEYLQDVLLEAKQKTPIL